MLHSDRKFQGAEDAMEQHRKARRQAGALGLWLQIYNGVYMYINHIFMIIYI